MKISELFDRGEFVVTAEVGPPKGFHLEGVIEAINAGADVDAKNDEGLPRLRLQQRTDIQKP